MTSPGSSSYSYSIPYHTTNYSFAHQLSPYAFTPTSAAVPSNSFLGPQPPISQPGAAAGTSSPSHERTEVNPATVEPPRKRPRRHASDEEQRLYDIARLSDAEVWAHSDADILAAFATRCQSPAYDHFVKSVLRHAGNGYGVGRSISIVLTCKYGNSKHAKHVRARNKQGNGTSNLVNAVRACDARRLGAAEAVVLPKYSEIRHRLLIALRCCLNKRSFASMQDLLYHEELRLVSGNPSICVPAEHTIQRDIERLYEGLGPSLTAYFKQRNRPYHVLLDGWTAPIHTSNIGIVLVWDDAGKIHRVLLELVKLEKRHTGQYLAEQVSKTLKLYQIDHLMHLLNQDNATNCDKTAYFLPTYISSPYFRGLIDRLRCFLHCVQLAAKMVLSFFNKQYKRKRAGGAAATGTSSAAPLPQVPDAASSTDAVERELQEILGEIENEAEQLAQLLDSDGQAEHDEEVVKGIRAQAIAEMSRRGVVISPEEVKAALRVLPKHAALAVKTRDQGPVRDNFEKLVGQNPPDTTIGCYEYISPRNATRWDSEHALLNSYHALHTAIGKLLDIRDLKLATSAEWNLSTDLCDMLAPIHEITLTFQQRNVPLIMDVIPAYDQLQQDFGNMVNCESLPNVCRVAAYAGLLVTQKYYRRTDDCDAYVIAIVMCPDRKLQWFTERGWPAEYVERIQEKIIRLFYEWFPRTETVSAGTRPPPMMRSSSQTTISPARGVHRWRTHETIAPQPIDSDDIMVYLHTPRVILPSDSDVLQYWNKELLLSRKLATFGLAFTSAPATTADAERAFSEGRNQVNWNQHSMSSQTFRAKMCVGSWSNAPWFDKDAAEKILAHQSRSLRSGSLGRNSSEESL